ncbi:MAG TPA: TlpA family protein disulfide reductase [Verrucomicrobia bacterium]|nr:TlpA family protein disulfide reductase [Verrucomicrobiota bacterium]HOP97117.1 TlpA disulfide reductase family protein [Verrucomicrobiota bacterium]HPU57112.1 TlpA disulfide reductase family protein [Verrucomicrobiota bacterium]
MKTKSLAVVAVLVACLLAPLASMAAETDAIQTELKALVDKVREKLKEGKKTEADLAAEFKAFDDLLAKHKGEKTDEVATIALWKAMLYDVVDNPDKAIAELEQIKKDFPDTDPGKHVDQIIAQIKKESQFRKGMALPDFAETDLKGKPLSISNYKGKVVLVDFWATWCGPCVEELPNVLKTYEKYHDQGFEIIGISLDTDRKQLDAFLEKHKGMTWPQYFDGKGWQNKLAEKYGIEAIPTTFLLDGEGKIIEKDLRGPELEKAVAAALKK